MTFTVLSKKLNKVIMQKGGKHYCLPPFCMYEPGYTGMVFWSLSSMVLSTPSCLA